MAIRIDIDEQDFARLQKETAPRFSRDTALLLSACAIIALGVAAAGTGLWRGFLALQAARASGAALAEPGIIIGAASLIFMALCVAALIIRKSRRKLVATRQRAAIKRGITIGRFEFMFTDAALVIKGAQGTRRASWASLDRITETKSMIVFWRRGDVFAFMPKNSLKDPAFYERLVRIHGPAIANKLECGKKGGVDPHRVSFECFDRDYAEHRRFFLTQTDAPSALLQQFFHWRAWPPILLLATFLIAGSASYIFVKTFSIAAGAVAVISTIASVAIFFLNAAMFRGAAFPFRKPARWPFAQSELVSVALFESGVCVTRGGVEEVYPWSAIERLIACRLTAYLTLTPLIVLPLPKRAFIDNTHFQAFASFAKARIKAAGHEAAAASTERLARRLAPGAAPRKTPSTPKATPQQTSVKRLPAKTKPKALPPAAPPKALPPSKKSKTAVDAVRAKAKARVAAFN